MELTIITRKAVRKRHLALRQCCSNYRIGELLVSALAVDQLGTPIRLDIGENAW